MSQSSSQPSRLISSSESCLSAGALNTVLLPNPVAAISSSLPISGLHLFSLTHRYRCVRTHTQAVWRRETADSSKRKNKWLRVITVYSVLYRCTVIGFFCLPGEKNCLHGRKTILECVILHFSSASAPKENSTATPSSMNFGFRPVLSPARQRA